jgi:D-alanyl-D-alanine carboxypeptidase (penicillin-binding protein 5/6)
VALAAIVVVALIWPAAGVAEPRTTDIVDGSTAGKRHLPTAGMPDVNMKAGALVTGDGRVLWARSPDARRAMASITKIMTAVVALENTSLSDMVTIPPASGQVGESTAFLRPGERLTMREVLQALLVKSGNDAAVAVARHVAPTDADFVKLMNQKAVELGLKGTHFMNPHGLDEPGHYTTASDLAVLSRYAMSNPDFRAIVGLKSVTIGSGKRTEKLDSTDLLIGNYAGAIGIKTGFTSAAGYSVVSAAERDGLTLYAVVLGTDTELQRFREARELLDWGFAHYRAQNLGSAKTVIGEAPVVDYLDVVVPAEYSRDATVSVLDVNGPITRTVTVGAVKAPVAQGQRVGVATFTQAGKVIATVPLVAANAVKKPNMFERVGIAFTRGWRRVFG